MDDAGHRETQLLALCFLSNRYTEVDDMFWSNGVVKHTLAPELAAVRVLVGGASSASLVARSCLSGLAHGVSVCQTRAVPSAWQDVYA